MAILLLLDFLQKLRQINDRVYRGHSFMRESICEQFLVVALYVCQRPRTYIGEILNHH